MIVVPDSAVPHLARQRQRTGDAYQGSLVRDLNMLAPYLPDRADVILDIGCGMAGIDVLLKQQYPYAELWLLDGDGNDPREGWNEVLTAFSSRAATEELLAANGVKVDRWFDVNTKEHIAADLIISIASWGYHYPISTYDVSGYCIADLRRGVEPVRGKVVWNSPQKRIRCAWHQ